MRLFCIIVFTSVLQKASCEEAVGATDGISRTVLHALPEFVSGETLAALKISVLHQFDKAAASTRCVPSSCVLPQAEVTTDVGEKVRQALLVANKNSTMELSSESMQTMDMTGLAAARTATHMHLPALRTILDGRSGAEFHDDFDVDEPENEATWTALLYLDASRGDRFMVRLRNNIQHVESHEIKPGTLILFKSSEVQHTAMGTTQESPRLALGPVALDKREGKSGVRGSSTASTNHIRARILGWGGGGGGGSKKSSSGACFIMCHQRLWIAFSVVVLTLCSHAM